MITEKNHQCVWTPVKAPLHEVALEIFRGLSQSYDLVVDLATLFQDRWWKKWAAAKLEVTCPRLVLDVGCGTLLFEERYPSPERHFVGLDLSRQMLTLGQDKGITNASMIVQGDAEHLPFRAAAFDSVISCYVAKYVEIGTFGNEMRRVTHQGGTVILYDFAKPRGIMAPFLLAYIGAGLRALGLVMRITKNRMAFAFVRLPQLIENTRWDLNLVNDFKTNGIALTDARPLTGGVVFAFSGRCVADVR